MPNFQQGKIYKVYSPDEPELIYIGSTCQKYLCNRLAAHKKCPNTTSRIIFEKYNNVKIELLETYPCDNIYELRNREGKWIKENKCVNQRISGRTNKEYYQDNKEHIKEYRKKWASANKEHIKEYGKQYRKANKQKRQEYEKMRYKRNAEQYKARVKKYAEENQKRLTEKMTCECGSIVSRRCMFRHKKTNKHRVLLQEQEDAV